MLEKNSDQYGLSILMSMLDPTDRTLLEEYIALWQVSFVASYPDAGELITSTILRAISTIIPPCPAARPLKSRVFRLKAGYLMYISKVRSV